MRGNSFEKHRARNVVIKTPLPIVIEDNDFSSHMSAIFLRGETFYWFESGNVENVFIQNNRFRDCASSGMEHAVLYVTPRLGKTFAVSSCRAGGGTMRQISIRYKTLKVL